MNPIIPVSQLCPGKLATIVNTVPSGEHYQGQQIINTGAQFATVGMFPCAAWAIGLEPPFMVLVNRCGCC